ncbi:molecular chaperone DnaJ [Pseudemcibacter aquimaris]|uniref:molecular chaperone DnaJ n=1 Tax=Pseudemcibacter aquimaris TaxID=2857064 RepID=UPI002011AF2D|nr:molecular chaperone DnaJ [Pseudemcibacter aquimaris]MCC3860343.1 molecular chaperone DnaJ [Pseudemcibacter aquimaris]WDU57669.1 molecular chaperone DnaJ [Pseudemcibacter aquimaris]
MSKQDYYETLGVDRSADAAGLKSAYRKLAMKYHPDRNPGDAEAEAKFKEVSEAYDILKDDQKRSAYDQYGHAAFENGGMGGGGGGFHGFEASGFSDIFEDLFGMGGGRRRDPNASRRGSDLRYNLTITLEDAFTGKSEKIKIPTSVACDTCDGSGAEDGTKPSACTTCNGIGKVRSQQGFFMVERTCPSCQGQGMTIENPCGDCSGTGKKNKNKTLDVKIPAGVEEGTRIRLSGEGKAGTRGGPSGDLYIFIDIEYHPIFQRDGSTVFCEIPIPMTTAALGGEIEVPTIGGDKTTVKISKGTQTGKRYKISGKGMPVLNRGTYGDMFIETNVETPVNLSKKQKELLRAFAEECGDDVSPEASGFINKAKELWEDLTD